MNTGSQILLVLALVGAAVTVHVVARPRAGRFLLARVESPGRHRRATRRVLVLNAISALVGAALVMAAPDPTGHTQLIAGFAAILLPPLWGLFELRRALLDAPLPPVPARFRVSLDRPPHFFSFLSPPLELLNLAAMIAPPLLLRARWHTGPGPWLAFFLPLMVFLTVLVLFCAWMQSRERWALPVADAERYLALQLDKRRRTVRLLETGLLCWNLGGALIWISVAAGSAGPGYLGAGLAAVVAGPGVAALMAIQLAPLTRIADEVAAIARTDVLGTRASGWRLGGLVYCSTRDRALFVPTRSGLGQTLNVGRPAAWLLVSVVLLVPSAITLLALAQARP